MKEDKSNINIDSTDYEIDEEKLKWTSIGIFILLQFSIFAFIICMLGNFILLINLKFKDVSNFSEYVFNDYIKTIKQIKVSYGKI